MAGIAKATIGVVRNVGEGRICMRFFMTYQD